MLGTAGGDNYGEGNLDVRMIAAFGLNVHTIVSNTNTSKSTEEGNGFGEVTLATKLRPCFVSAIFLVRNQA